jgi:hypothetical protein
VNGKAGGLRCEEEEDGESPEVLSEVATRRRKQNGGAGLGAVSRATLHPITTLSEVFQFWPRWRSCSACESARRSDFLCIWSVPSIAESAFSYSVLYYGIYPILGETWARPVGLLTSHEPCHGEAELDFDSERQFYNCSRDH